MEAETFSISLVEQLSEPGFRSSVIATYCCYFPFYEEVVLRRLVSSGCTHNVLFVDADMCAEAFASDVLRPRRAGRDYTLIPVRVGGAFHPKILMRLGKTKGALFVGSHNLTLAGFGLNDEITNSFRAEGAKAREAASPFRVAFEYLAHFLPKDLTDAVDAYDQIKVGIPWIESGASVTEDRVLLTSVMKGDNLWSQLLPRVPKPVDRIFLCGPFFDPKLAFIQRVVSDVEPRELIIGIDPGSVELDPDAAAAIPTARFVNVNGLVDIPNRRENASPYLHAKLLWFQGRDTELLVSGSANPSVAAFLASEARRNAEAVVADHRKGVAGRLGIDAMIDAPMITNSDWAEIRERHLKCADKAAGSSQAVTIGISTTNGFRTQAGLEVGCVLDGFDDKGDAIGVATVCAANTIEAVDLVRDGAAFLRSQGSPSIRVLVIVHRTDEISQNYGGEGRKALRAVLGAIEEDPSQLEALLKLTEKVIFDFDDDIVRPISAVATTQTEPTSNPIQQGSLAIDASGRKDIRKRRSMASGDIVLLIEALIRRLGEGLAATSKSRTLEQEAGSDEEEGGEIGQASQFDHEKLAKACRSKARKLVRRMASQLELASAPGHARRVVIQLAAVLGVIRILRIAEMWPEWRQKRLELVDRDDEWELFRSAVLAVHWGANALAGHALTEAGGELFDEFSMVTGLLAWLAWEAGADACVMYNSTATPRPEPDMRWMAVQHFSLLAPWLARDPVAQRYLDESVSRTPRYRMDAERWVSDHLIHADSYTRIVEAPEKQIRRIRQVRAGDLMILGETANPRLRVVLEVIGGGERVVCFDPKEENERRVFLSSKVVTLPWIQGDQ